MEQLQAFRLDLEKKNNLKHTTVFPSTHQKKSYSFPLVETSSGPYDLRCALHVYQRHSDWLAENVRLYVRSGLQQPPHMSMSVHF